MEKTRQRETQRRGPVTAGNGKKEGTGQPGGNTGSGRGDCQQASPLQGMVAAGRA